MKSQTDTSDVRPIAFPFWMVKEIAIDLEEKDRLESLQEIHLQLISNLQHQKDVLKSQGQNKDSQLHLLRETNNILSTQLRAEKAKKPESNWLMWSLGVLAAFGTGMIIGVAN